MARISCPIAQSSGNTSVTRGRGKTNKARRWHFRISRANCFSTSNAAPQHSYAIITCADINSVLSFKREALSRFAQSSVKGGPQCLIWRTHGKLRNAGRQRGSKPRLSTSSQDGSATCQKCGKEPAHLTHRLTNVHLTTLQRRMSV